MWLSRYPLICGCIVSQKNILSPWVYIVLLIVIFHCQNDSYLKRKYIYVICHGGLKVKTFIVAEARLMYE